MGENTTTIGEALAAKAKASETANESKQPSLEEMLKQPLSENDARKLAADIDVQLAQLQALRIQRSLELSQLDYQIAAAQFDKAVIYRRVLNPTEETK